MASAESGIEEVAAGFVRFAEEARGSSPLYTLLSPAVARDRELCELLLAAPPAQRRPNLLFAAAHDLLLSGVEHPVLRYYPSLTAEAAPPDAAASGAFRDLCLFHRAALRETIAARRTQTNEARRSVALLPVLQRLASAEAVALVEVGASAGLNLLLDRFRYRFGEGPWLGDAGSPVAIRCEPRGAALPVRAEPPRIAFRVGLDSHPLDVRDAGDARWLEACVWPEHADRLELLRAALHVARLGSPRIVRGDAVRDLEAVVEEVPADLAVCLFHSATLPYLTAEECAAFVSTIDRIGRRRRLHWVSLEGGALQSFGAELPFGRLHVARACDRPTDIFGLLGHADWVAGVRRERLLARVDMHGRWIEWLDGR